MDIIVLIIVGFILGLFLPSKENINHNKKGSSFSDYEKYKTFDHFRNKDK